MFWAQVEQRPLLLLVEDAHWTDPSTIDLLKRLVELTPAGAKLCVVMAMRPEEAAAPPLKFDLELELGLLCLDDSIDVVQQYSQIRLSRDIAEAISKRVEGVPLFLEEYTRAVVSDPQLLQATVAEIRFDVDKIDIPASLNDALMARLDRQPGLQLIAQRASILGREFSEVILARLVNMGLEDLRVQLDGLVQADVLRPINYAGTERRYEYFHALVRDVAYRSLLSGKRRELHCLVAEFSADIDVLKDRHIWPAEHFAAASEPVPAISLYLDAINALQRKYAYSEIGGVARDALKLIDSTGDARNDTSDVALQMIEGVENTAVCKPFYLSNAADGCLRLNRPWASPILYRTGIGGTLQQRRTLVGAGVISPARHRCAGRKKKRGRDRERFSKSIDDGDRA